MECQPTKPPRALGPKQKAWIARYIKPAHEGAKKVADSDRRAAEARRIAYGEDDE